MKRPRIITTICILGYLTVLFSFPQVFSPSVKKLGVWMPAVYGILVAMHFISCVGLWYVKQWGVELYLIAFFAKTIFFLTTDQTGVTFYLGLVFSICFSIILLRFYRRMSPNL
jgi:hypothetical protein